MSASYQMFEETVHHCQTPFIMRKCNFLIPLSSLSKCVHIVLESKIGLQSLYIFVCLFICLRGGLHKNMNVYPSWVSDRGELKYI